MLAYAKTYVTSSDYITDNIVNDNARSFINSLRVIDDIQLPVEAVLSQSLFTPSLGNFDSDRSGAHTDTIGFIAPSQSIFYTSGTIEDLTGWQRAISAPAGSSPAVLPTFGPPQISYSDFGKVQPFTNANGIYAFGTFMRVPCREGMLHCEWTGDIEAPFTRGTATAQNFTEQVSLGRTWTFNVGLYVDGVLVSHSGELPWGQRKPIHLDCSIPIGEKEVEIEVKWQAKIDRNQLRILEEDFTLVSNNPEMHLFNAQLFARNQYR